MADSAAWCDPNETPADPNKAPGQARQQAFPDLTRYMCERNWQPHMISGLLADILRHHFRPGSIEHPALVDAQWLSDATTGVVVTTLYNWTEKVAGKRPQVLIVRNSYRNINPTLRSGAGVQSFKGVTRHATFWVGSHTLFAINSRRLAADILAAEVQREIGQFADVLTKPSTLGLAAAAVTEVGAQVELEEAKTAYAVPVTFGWAFQERWQVQQIEPILRRVTVSTMMGL